MHQSVRQRKKPVDIGFVGLGMMGLPMANILLKRDPRILLHVPVGHAKSNLSRLIPGHRVVRHERLADLAAAVRVCFTMLPMPADVERVIVSDGDSLLAGMQTNTVVIDCSTSSAELARTLDRRLGKVRCAAVDSPVSGAPARAAAGTLSLMVGARKPIFQKVRPLLELLGTPTYIGPPGAGQITKSINQLIVGLIGIAISEGIILGRRAGIDLEAMLRAVGGGMAGSEYMRLKGPDMVRGDFAPRFYLRYHLKDLNIALQTAADLGLKLPFTTLARKMMREGIRLGRGDLDNSGILTVLESLNKKRG